jgi:hypothetical protein
MGGGTKVQGKTMYETVIQISSIKYSESQSIIYDVPETTTTCGSDLLDTVLPKKVYWAYRYPDVYCITECVLLSSHYITTPQ